MKKCLCSFLFLIICIFCFSGSIFAAEPQFELIASGIINSQETYSARAIGLIYSYSVNVYKLSSDTIDIRAVTISPYTVKEVGVRDVIVQRFTGSSWTNIKCVNSSFSTNAVRHNFLKSFTLQTGYTYRVVLYHYAKDSTIEQIYNISSTFNL